MESWFKTIASASDVLVGISTAVAVELEQWLGGQGLPQGERPRLGYFHLGAGLGIGARNRDLAADAMQVLSRLASLPTFLMVGTLEPRKGHRQVLGAFERLWRDGADVALVIVGKHGWLIDELAERLRRHTEFGQRLFWLEGISDEYLEKLYAASTCLIAASEGEGFGLPLIEAAQHRLPIIARDIAVFREVAGQHAYYFSGMSPEALADAVRNWMGLRSAGNAPSSEGMRWLTWAESTGQLLQVVLGTNTDRSGVVAQETGAAAT
jgi:glycosyltransferase involved in cell wall biosynthesis